MGKLSRVELWTEYEEQPQVIYDAVSSYSVDPDWLLISFPNGSHEAHRLNCIYRYRVTPHE